MLVLVAAVAVVHVYFQLLSSATVLQHIFLPFSFDLDNINSATLLLLNVFIIYFFCQPFSYV